MQQMLVITTKIATPHFFHDRSPGQTKPEPLADPAESASDVLVKELQGHQSSKWDSVNAKSLHRTLWEAHEKVNFR